MWVVNGNNLKMTEGDFGIVLPVTVNGITFTANDEIMFTLKRYQNDADPVLTLTFSDIVDNTIEINLTQELSNLLSVGTYVYSLDWYQSGEFMCNIIPSASFKVVDKV